MSIMEKKHSRHRSNGEGGYGIIGGKVRMVRERESEKSQTVGKLSHCQDMDLYSE